MRKKLGKENGKRKKDILHQKPYGMEAGKAKYTILYFGSFRGAKANKWETHFSGRIK